ncbi:MAG: DinB family protein [Bryobacteraceae bacterium]
MTPAEIALSVDVSREFFNRSTRELKEENSNFAPVPGMYTAAALVAHVAQTVDWFFAGAFAPGGFDTDFEKMDKEVRACASLDAARALFNAACDRAKAAAEGHSEADWAALLPPGPVMGGMPRHAIVNALTDHTAHHRGALSVYTRLVGRVPPMPYMEM